MPTLQAFMARVRIAGEKSLLAGYPNAWPGADRRHDSIGPARASHRRRSGRSGAAVVEADVPEKIPALCLHTASATTPPSAIWQSSLTILQSRDALLSMLGDLNRVMAI